MYGIKADGFCSGVHGFCPVYQLHTRFEFVGANFLDRFLVHHIPLMLLRCAEYKPKLCLNRKELRALGGLFNSYFGEAFTVPDIDLLVLQITDTLIAHIRHNHSLRSHTQIALKDGVFERCVAVYL